MRKKRIESIDLLRGIVMIIMTLDHVRDYFHKDAFIFNPVDLTKTNALLFFTRWITHYCAPVFVFLSGISAFLYGEGKSKKELSLFLLTRGLWLMFAELFIVTLGWTFNPTYPIFNLQVIWTIGVCMIVLAALVHLKRNYVLFIGCLIIIAHNLLDNIHITSNKPAALLWALIHDPGDFKIGNHFYFIHYSALPWIGIIAAGYWFGGLYTANCNVEKRKKVLLLTGTASIIAFTLLRLINYYGDASLWQVQKSNVFSLLSFINVTKYPPSLLYTLITLGPALIFLALAEKPLNFITKRIIVFGRVPMFFYLLHIYLIHTMAIFAAAWSGFNWTNMVMLNNRVNRVSSLEGYGFSLAIAYAVWVTVIILLYPFCKWFAAYKRANHHTKKWLTYI